MHKLKTFISKNFRPDVLGGKLDKKHRKRFQLSQDHCRQDYPELKVSAICFGPKKDNVLINLEHVIENADNIVVLYYEDIHSRWTFVNNNEESYFLYRKNKEEQFIIKPRCLYIRGCYISSNDKYWNILGDFFSFVDMWDGMVLCSPKKQMPNESKLYQLNNSLMRASKNFPAISIGKSYVVKGVARFKFLKAEGAYIVKSLSGIRSVVVDKNSYKNWDFNTLDNVPVLFQEKVDGNDLRAHVINKNVYGKLSISKDNVDYRYDKGFFNLQDVDNLDKDLVDFCVSVSLEEENQMLGIDFIKTSSGYVVLEANPSPGWSAYHPYNGINDDPFIAELLRVLKSG